jgi:hypothetical protein
VDIALGAGQHEVHETQVITKRHLPQGRHLNISGEGAERSIVSASRSVETWQRWEQLEESTQERLKALPESARSEIRVAQLPEDTRDFKVLYAGMESLKRARSAPFEPRQVDVPTFRSFNVARAEDRHHLKTVPLPAGFLKDLSDLGETEVFFTAVPWQLSILPVSSYDEKHELLRTRIEGTCPAFTHPKKPGWLENHLSWLEQAGQWVFLSKPKILVFWPQWSGQELSIRVPQIKTSLRIEGEVDHDTPNDEPVTHGASNL